MVVGIVDWATRNGGQESIDAAIAACLAVAGDPRHDKGTWRDIPSRTIDQVHEWLTARTIENMFLVIDTLRTDHPDQVASRLAFWREYLPHIRRAYLVCARRAKPVAERLKETYGHMDSNDPVHCGLLMEIVGPSGDRLVVLETNKNASALFWKPNSRWQPPDFYGPGPYDRLALLNACDKRINHTGNWQRSFSTFISGETGIRHSAGENAFG
jgi:EH_Signature domain